jgi:hypothetical protein
MYYIRPFPDVLMGPQEVDNGHCARLVQVAVKAPQARLENEVLRYRTIRTYRVGSPLPLSSSAAHLTN